jgi:RNA polymerase sigma-70 factor (ECF subfamily)
MFPTHVQTLPYGDWTATGGLRSLVPLFPFQRTDSRTRDAESRAREFDAQALPYMDDLFRMALRMTRDRSRAEDAVQEAYLQAWKSFDRFEPGTNARAWLYRVLFNCVHHQRRKWLRFPTAGGDPDEILDTVPAPVMTVADKLTDGQILAALDEIPTDYRAVVLLVDVEEFAYKDASEILGVPIGTVMSRLSRGRKALRKQLEDVAKSYGIVKSHGKESAA